MPGFEWIGAEERAAVTSVLETGVFMRYGFDAARRGRWPARELESRLAARFGVPYVHVCSSGTAAVFAALAAAGVGAGDEVIVPPFTFVADIEAVLWLGAVPVFAEVDETLCLAPEAVAAAITPRTKAALVVHMCGSMARLDALVEVCAQHGVMLIEDAAQATGATFRGQSVGTFGRVGCFSFDYVKTLTCGEGGAVVTRDEGLHSLLQAFTDHGHDHRGADRGADQHPIIGLNFRLSELHAALGLAQLDKLDRILDRQRAHQRFLKDGLAGLPRITFREVPDPDGDSATFLSLFLPSEEEARQASRRLSAAGVDGCFYWYDNNWHYHRQWEHFRQLATPGRLAVQQAGWLQTPWTIEVPASDRLLGRTLSLLIKLNWTPDQLEQRLATLCAVLA